MMASDAEIVEVLSETLEEVGELALPARGASMGPRFGDLDGVVIRRVVPGELSVGSILVFRRHGRLLAHRIVWRFSSGSDFVCVTRGDGLFSFDQPFVAADEVIGLVVALVRGKERISLETAWRRICGVCRGLTGLAGGLTAALVRRLKRLFRIARR